MALTLNDLPTQDPGNVSDDDLLLTWETGAGSSPSRKLTVGNLKADLPRTNGNADFADVTADDIAATTGTINTLEVATSLTLGAVITKVLAGALSVTASTLTAGATEDKTATLTGALTTDAVMFSISGLPAGLIVSAWVSAADTVTFRIFNATSGSITGAAYTARTVAIRAT